MKAILLCKSDRSLEKILKGLLEYSARELPSLWLNFGDLRVRLMEPLRESSPTVFFPELLK